MEKSTKKQIIASCKQNTTTKIEMPDFFSQSSDTLNSYEVKENGNIIKTTYQVIKIICSGFGCSYPTLEATGHEVIGNCDSIDFLNLL